MIILQVNICLGSILAYISDIIAIFFNVKVRRYFSCALLSLTVDHKTTKRTNLNRTNSICRHVGEKQTIIVVVKQATYNTVVYENIY